MTQLREQVAGEIWVQERNLWFSGVRLRSRSTVVRLPNGGLWLHSPAEPTDDVCRELGELGEVAWIVVPNRYHHLQAAAWKRRYPSAQLIAPEAARARNPNVVPDRDIAEPSLPSELSVFRFMPLRGVPFLDETTFFHEPTRTLIGADLMMCGCAKDHFTWRWVSRVLGQYEQHKVPPDVRMHTKANADARESVEALLQLPMARILVAHSDAVEERPKEQLRAAWNFVL